MGCRLTWGGSSSWNIERQCLVNGIFRVIAANRILDYSIICRFRQWNREAMDRLLVHVSRLCAESGFGWNEDQGERNRSGKPDHEDAQRLRARIQRSGSCDQGSIIIAAEVTQEENEVRQIHPTLEKEAETLESAGVNEKLGIALAEAPPPRGRAIFKKRGQKVDLVL